MTLALVAVAAMTAARAADAAPTRSLGGGAWSWFGDPRAVHHKGTYNRTYIGWIDREGDIKVASYDHGTRLRVTAVLRWRLGIDDHNNPSLHVRPDGRLMAFYSRDSRKKMSYRVSRRPEDITSWGRERTIRTNTSGSKGYTYPNPVQLRAERNRLWLFWRGGNWQPTFSTSTDGGNTWAAARTLVTYPDDRPYIKFSSNKRDRIHFAFTQGHPRNLNTNIYHAYYRNGALYRANGTRIKSMSSLPLAPSETDKVYDTRYRSWVHDIALDSRGRPIIVFAVFRSTSDHRYYYARWTGLRWRRYGITPAGGTISDSREPHYSGGITLDHENPSVVYLSHEVKGMHEIETWRTPDRGRRWRRQVMTSGSRTENVRPVSPRGLLSFDNDLSVVWMRGSYDHYVDYQTDITTRLLRGGNGPPVAEAAVSPRSGRAPLSVRFDGRRSKDSDGSIVRWSWNFGDRSGGSGSAVSHTYSSPGRYFVRLTVTDDLGDKDVFVTEVVVDRARR
jgi:hypothetical protein